MSFQTPFCAVEQLHKWIENQSFQGWDPFDALNSPFIPRQLATNRRIGQILVQLLKHCPVNLRPLLGIQKGFNPKGMGLFLNVYSRRYQASKSTSDLVKMEFFSRWLQDHRSPGNHGACWGYNFDWPNRSFYAPAGTPTIVNTAFVGLAFLQAYQALVKNSDADCIAPSLNNGMALEVARSACEFVLKDLGRFEAGKGSFCFSYTPLDSRFIHNASLLGAWLLSSVYTYTGEEMLSEAAVGAARYSVSCQRYDGSWWYGEDSKDHWIDNFHTGYVLVALLKLSQNLNLLEFDTAIEKGYELWKMNFFLSDGTPKFYPDKIYPIDIHSVSQAILTFLAFRQLDPEAERLAHKVAEWGTSNMQEREGYFDYQIHRFYRIRIPYMRWSQAWMFHASTELIHSKEVIPYGI